MIGGRHESSIIIARTRSIDSHRLSWSNIANSLYITITPLYKDVRMYEADYKIRLSTPQRRLWDAAASKKDVSLSVWIRSVLDEEARVVITEK